MEDLASKFITLADKITDQSFLKKEALGGEIPFFISPYDAKQEVEVRKEIFSLKKKLNTRGIDVLEINLYDLVCEILDDNIGIEKMLEIEKARNKERFLRALQSSLNIQQVLMPKIKELIDASEAKVYFLTGIGLVFPYIRSHTILNNLQSVAKEAPMLAFFPGDYNGYSLNLFGLLKDDNYYRAFNIDNIEF